MTDLLNEWTGPFGGLPPFDRADPATIESAYRIAIERKREAIRSISTDPEAPTFANTIEALEASGRDLERAECLHRTFASTMSSPEMQTVEARLAPLLPALEDQTAHDAQLFARILAVGKADARLEPEQRRLAEIVRDRFLRRGAGLTPEAQRRLTAINERISILQVQFNQHLSDEQATLVVDVDDERELDGLADAVRAQAAAEAASRGRPGTWAIANARPAVMAVLATSTRRLLRERVWRMWNTRGDHRGALDNVPVIAEILKLRGEKARLFGFANFAEYALADRMAKTPEAALAAMHAVWDAVVEPTRRHLCDLQTLADADGVTVAAWDRLYYAERLRAQRFAIDDAALKPYFSLPSVLRAMLWTASRLYDLTFEALPDAPVCHPDIRVYGVKRFGEPVGAVWFDLFERTGKMRGSWQYQYRAAETFRGRVTALVSVNSSVPRPVDGGQVQLTWELARVLFHELGHALHMLLSTAPYPSLGSMTVPWDMIELPSLLNERWLEEETVLTQFARHEHTGEAMALELVERLRASLAADRVFTVTLDYLATALVDMHIHLAADGSEVDARAIERDVFARIGLPEAVDPTMRVTHLHHSFTDVYAAGVYAYLWADMMAADAAEAFAQAPGGFFDRATAQRWLTSVLSAANRVAAAEAFRAFRGRDPDPSALPRRFALTGSR